MSSKKKANKKFRHGWASEGKDKKEKAIFHDHMGQVKNQGRVDITHRHVLCNHAPSFVVCCVCELHECIAAMAQE